MTSFELFEIFNLICLIYFILFNMLFAGNDSI